MKLCFRYKLQSNLPHKCSTWSRKCINISKSWFSSAKDSAELLREYEKSMAEDIGNRDFATAFSRLKVVRSEHLLPTAEMYRILFTEAMFRGSDYVQEVYLETKKDGKLDESTCNVALQSLRVTFQFEHVVALYEEMKMNHIPVHQKSYGYVMYSLYALGRIIQMSELLQDMKHRNVRPTFEVYRPLLYHYGHNKDTAKFESTIQEMQDNGIPMDRNVINIMVSFYMTLGEGDKIVKIMDFMKSNKIEPSVEICTSLINYFARTGKAKELINIAKEVNVSGYPLSARLIDIIIKTFQKAPLQPSMIKFCEFVAETHHKFGTKQPLAQGTLIRTQLIAIRYYCSIGELELAMKSYINVKSSEYMDGDTFNWLIMAHLQKNDLETTLSLFGDLAEGFVEANLFTLHLARQYCEMAGLQEAKAAIMRLMMRKGKVANSTMQKVVELLSKIPENEKKELEK